MRYSRVISILLVALQTVCTNQARAKQSSDYVASTFVTITRDKQCLRIFSGLVRKAAKGQTSAAVNGQMSLFQDPKTRITLILSPGCDSGTWGVWPAFSNNIHFDFAVSNESDKLDFSHVLKAEPTGDFVPQWSEAASTRILNFEILDMPSTYKGILRIIVFSAGTKLTQLELKINP